MRIRQHRLQLLGSFAVGENYPDIDNNDIPPFVIDHGACYYIATGDHCQGEQIKERGSLASFTKPSIDRIIQELGIESFLPAGDDRKTIIDSAKEALEAMHKYPGNYRLHVEKVHEFMKALWIKYDCDEVFGVLDALTSIEPALLDLERDPEAGKRYRDHYVHVFHVFVLGLRVLNGIIEKLGDDEASDILKVRKEELGGRIKGQDATGTPVEFHDYNWKERMFYMWTLMSTLHDIAVPITHLPAIRDALNRFSDKFHLQISGPELVARFTGDLEAYLSTVSRLFEGKFQPLPGEPWRYEKGARGAYLKGYLERLVSRNHGVLGGYLAYKMIEEIFLHGKSQKYRLALDSFEHYRELVLEEDVARATLGICLHDIRRDDDFQMPDFMPLAFFDYPLIFVLILADSLQEYLRWEGCSIRGDTKLTGFPVLKIKAKPNRIEVECSFSLTDNTDEQAYFITEVNRILESRHVTPTGNTIKDVANDFCSMLDQDLGKKIKLSSTGAKQFILRLLFFENKNHLCTQTLITP